MLVLKLSANSIMLKLLMASHAADCPWKQVRMTENSIFSQVTYIKSISMDYPEIMLMNNYYLCPKTTQMELLSSCLISLLLLPSPPPSHGLRKEILLLHLSLGER
jgi:hypothetical protein